MATIQLDKQDFDYPKKKGINRIWVVIFLFWAFPFIFFMAHLSALTNYLFPISAFCLSIVLYRTSPRLYISNTWWLWFITPEIRRLVDYQVGFQSVSPVMLSPYLATGLAFFTVVAYLPELRYKLLFPMALASAGVIYGYLVGVINAGILAATFGLLNWILPIFIGLYVAIQWRHYNAFKKTIYHTFVWGSLIMGLYGVIQYIDPPPWDRYWMLASKMLSIGLPIPYHVRIFSTMNSPGPFAMEIMGTLLMLTAGGGFWRIPAAVFGYISLLLSLVRTAWGGWAVAILYLIFRFKPENTIRYLIAGIMVITLALPILTFGPIAKDLNKRIQSIENVKQNASYQSRIAFYEDFIGKSLDTPIGSGIGNVGVAARLSSSGHVVDFDSGIMEIPYVLGWLGGMLFLIGTIWILLYISLSKWTKIDPFIAISSAIALAVFSTIIFFNSLIGSTGMFFWEFAGMAVAGIRFHRSMGSRSGTWQ